MSLSGMAWGRVVTLAAYHYSATVDLVPYGSPLLVFLHSAVPIPRWLEKGRTRYFRYPADLH